MKGDESGEEEVELRQAEILRSGEAELKQVEALKGRKQSSNELRH